MAITYSLAHSVFYVFAEFIPRNSVWDLFLPVTSVRCWLGYASVLDTLLLFVFYSLLWFFVTTVGLLAEQWRVIRKGVTAFEEDNNMKVINRRMRADNIRGVFGQNWWANFIIPLHWMFETGDDGIEWDGISI